MSHQFRAVDYEDIDTGTPIFSIEVRPDDLPEYSPLHWYHMHSNGKPLEYSTAWERDAVMDSLRKQA